jgi:uncharacterized membrane protein YbhN (UPF0104 family)
MQSKLIRKIINYSLGIVLFLWVGISIYKQIKHQPNFENILFDFQNNWTSERISYLIIVIILMLLNWSVEAIKWRLILKNIEAISFFRSLRSVFTGISISLLTPNRIGEYAGRIIYLKDENKIEAVAANMVGSFAQIIVANIFGIIGITYYLSVSSLWYLPWFLAGSIILLIVLIYLYFRLDHITEWLGNFSFFTKIKNYITNVQKTDKATLVKLIGISASRYLIFSIQYFLLLHFFMVPISIEHAMPVIFLIFWAMAILPTFALAEAPIRSEMSFYFLGIFSTNALGIMSASILLWLINLIFPALLGTLFMLGVKIFSGKEEN